MRHGSIHKTAVVISWAAVYGVSFGIQVRRLHHTGNFHEIDWKCQVALRGQIANNKCNTRVENVEHFVEWISN